MVSRCISTWIQIWTLHNFHVKTTLFPCGHHIFSTWTPCSFYAHYMVTMWILCGFHVHTMWFQGGHHLVSRLTQCGFQVDNTGFQKWILCGFYRTPQGFHMDATWTPCVVEVTTWKPAKKQLCMKPTGFLVEISCSNLHYRIMITRIYRILSIPRQCTKFR